MGPISWLGRGFACAMLVLGFAGPAGAATLATAPFSPGFGGPVTGINCVAANVGAKARQVTIEIREADAVVSSQTFDLTPGNTANISHFDTGTFYCRFAFKGGAKNLRAASHAVDADFSPYAIEPAR